MSGEYVMELQQYIWERRELFDRIALGRWLNENRSFYSLTRSRIVSYWDAYYRRTQPDFKSYVGGQLIAFFDEHL